jgi:hypothetical protein
MSGPVDPTEQFNILNNKLERLLIAEEQLSAQMATVNGRLDAHSKRLAQLEKAPEGTTSANKVIHQVTDAGAPGKVEHGAKDDGGSGDPAADQGALDEDVIVTQQLGGSLWVGVPMAVVDVAAVVTASLAVIVMAGLVAVTSVVLVATVVLAAAMVAGLVMVVAMVAMLVLIGDMGAVAVLVVAVVAGIIVAVTAEAVTLVAFTMRTVFLVGQSSTFPAMRVSLIR